MIRRVSDQGDVQALSLAQGPIVCHGDLFPMAEGSALGGANGMVLLHVDLAVRHKAQNGVAAKPEGKGDNGQDHGTQPEFAKFMQHTFTGRGQYGYPLREYYI
jgi:hypothetical protein